MCFHQWNSKVRKYVHNGFEKVLSIQKRTIWWSSRTKQKLPRKTLSKKKWIPQTFISKNFNITLQVLKLNIYCDVTRKGVISTSMLMFYFHIDRFCISVLLIWLLQCYWCDLFVVDMIYLLLIWFIYCWYNLFVVDILFCCWYNMILSIWYSIENDLYVVDKIYCCWYDSSVVDMINLWLIRFSVVFYVTVLLNDLVVDDMIHLLLIWFGIVDMIWWLRIWFICCW